MYDRILAAITFEDMCVEEKLYAMSMWGCELDEMAIEVNLTVEALLDAHREVMLSGYNRGQIDIRREQHIVALSRDGKAAGALLKHLGQHRLRQIDSLIVGSWTDSLKTKKTDMKDLSLQEMQDLLLKKTAETFNLTVAQLSEAINTTKNLTGDNK